jgi:hypothetical protein
MKRTLIPIECAPSNTPHMTETGVQIVTYRANNTDKCTNRSRITDRNSHLPYQPHLQEAKDYLSLVQPCLRSLNSSWRRETQALPTSRGQKKVADLLEKSFTLSYLTTNL